MLHDTHHAVDLLRGEARTLLHLPLTSGERASLRYALDENLRRMELGAILFGDLAHLVSLPVADGAAWAERLRALLDDAATTRADWELALLELAEAVRASLARMGH